MQTIVQGFCRLDNIKISLAFRILTLVLCQMLLSSYIYLLLSDCFDRNVSWTCMYVQFISLIGVHTHSSTCNLSLHKEKFEPASVEHN